MDFHGLWLIGCVFNKGRSFCGLQQYRNSFGGNIPQKLPKRGVNRQFQAKPAEYKNRDILQSINTINMQFYEIVEPKSWVVRYDVIPTPRWRTAAILKIENAQRHGRLLISYILLTD